MIGSRLKLSGMFWTDDAENAILALRCAVLNGELEDDGEKTAESPVPTPSLFAPMSRTPTSV